MRSFLPQLKHADSVLQQRMKEEPQENMDIEMWQTNNCALKWYLMVT